MTKKNLIGIILGGAVTVLASSFSFAMEKVAADDADPKGLPVNMMAQFYKVSESQVTAEVSHQTSQEATVVARGPNGQRCTFNLVRAPTGVQAPTGWLMADSSCARSGGGIPTYDFGAANSLIKGQDK